MGTARISRVFQQRLVAKFDLINSAFDADYLSLSI